MRRSRAGRVEFADRTGRGQLVEMPMIESVLNVTAMQTIEFEVFGKILSRRGNRGHPAATQDLYRCEGDDNGSRSAHTPMRSGTRCPS